MQNSCSREHLSMATSQTLTQSLAEVLSDYKGFINLIENRFLSLFRAYHWKFLCLLMVLHLLSKKVINCAALLLYEKIQ